MLSNIDDEIKKIRKFWNDGFQKGIIPDYNDEEILPFLAEMNERAILIYRKNLLTNYLNIFKNFSEQLYSDAKYIINGIEYYLKLDIDFKLFIEDENIHSIFENIQNLSQKELNAYFNFSRDEAEK